MTQPLADMERWQLVIEAADFRCQCTGGVCGSRHASTGLRCKGVHDQGSVRLIAAPLDLTLPDTAAVALPAGSLRAWCPNCYQAARRRQRETAEEARRLINGPPAALF